MAAARRAVPTLDASLAQGDLSPLLHWLRANVHGKGSLLEFNPLLQGATGEPLNPAYFQQHLTARYLQ
jgi:carboxypeptidase Taq